MRIISCKSQYFYAVDSDMYFDDDNNNNKTKTTTKITKSKQQITKQHHPMHCCVSTTKWLHKRATILRYTFVAYLK